MRRRLTVGAGIDRWPNHEIRRHVQRQREIVDLRSGEHANIVPGLEEILRQIADPHRPYLVGPREPEADEENSHRASVAAAPALGEPPRCGGGDLPRLARCTSAGPAA